MSRHIPRHARWNKLGPSEYTSACGAVRFEKGAWWASVNYRLCIPSPTPNTLLEWEEHSDRLGPFKRPRNAMMAVEQHALILQRRHGEQVVVGKGGGVP